MKKLTHEEYENKLFNKEIDYWPIEPYRGSAVSILHECLEGHKWSVKPAHILSGHGCSMCKGNILKSTEIYVDQLIYKNPNFKLKEGQTYINARTPIVHICDNNHEQSLAPTAVLKGYGCKDCNWLGPYSLAYFKNNPNKSIELGTFYFVGLYIKDRLECIKIGIVRGKNNFELNNRLKEIPYKTEILFTKIDTLYSIYCLEQDLLMRLKNHTYISSIKFSGDSELLSITALSELNAILIDK